jgi:hypothetical protein
MRGGDIGEMWGSVTNAVSDAYKKAQETVAGPTYTPAPTYTPPPAPVAPVAPATATGYGGKRRRTQKQMKMKGGFSPNTPTTGLAFNASPISGIPSVKTMWVGGKSKKRRANKSAKSRKNRKSRKY